MTTFLRQSTSQVIRFGPFLDKDDGVSEEVALTIAQADMRLSKDGGAFAQKNASGNATHDEFGWYSTTLNTTDTDTVGKLTFAVRQPANALPVWMDFQVLEEAVFDALYEAAAAGPLQSTTAGRKLDVTAAGEAGIDLDNTVGTLAAAQIASAAFTEAKFGVDFITAASIADDSITVDQLADDTITAAKIGADAITAAKVAADVHAESADAVWDEPKAGHVGATTFGDLPPAVAAVQTTVDDIEVDTIAIGGETTAILADTADMQPKIGAPAADLSADIAAVKVDTAATLVDTGTTLPALLPAALVGGRMDSDVGNIQANAIDAPAIAANAITAAKIATDAITAAKIAANAIGASELATDAIGAAQLATDAVDEIRDAILPVKNAALPDIVFLMVDDTDHFTPKTGLSLTVTRSIDGAAYGAGTGTVAEIADGTYQYDASAADMNGTNITFRFVGTDADDRFISVRTGG